MKWELSVVPSKFLAFLVGAAAFAILTCGTVTLHAQQTFGRILGAVQDSSGAAIPSASVAIRNVATGVEHNTVSGADGYYNDPQVLPGTYTVTATVQGFSPAAVQNVVVNVATDTRVDLKLTVGSVTQNVTVTEALPQIDTTNSSVGGTVNEQKLTELPLNGRNWSDLTLLQTGVTQVRAVLTTAGMQGMTFSAHGADTRSNTYLLDGTLTQNVFANNNSSIINTSLGLDGIQEYKVVTNLPSAEYGLVTGAQTVISSKGGTNTWHGDAYDFMRNRVLDARNAFDPVGANGNNINFPTKRNPPFIRNNFGGAFGGPIKKDKTFIWGVYEGLRQRRGATNNTTTLPLGCFYDRNNVFHNTVQSTVNNSLTNPAVVTYGSKANCVGTPPATPASTGTTPGTIYVPGVSQYLASVFPAPNFNQGGASGNNYTFPWTEPSAENMGQIRVDQNFSQNDSLFGRYTQDVADQTQNTPYPEMLYELHSASQFVTVGETHTFSSSILNTARLGFARTQLVPAYGPNKSALGTPYLNNSVAGQPAPDPVTGFPVTSAYFDIPPGISPGQGNQGAVTAFTPAPGPTPLGGKGNVQNVITFSDDVFWTKGKHSFKFGVLINRFQDSLNYDLFGNGTISFSNNSAFFGVSDPATGSPVGTPGYPVYSQLNWISAGVPSGCSGAGCTIVPASNQSHSYIYNTYGFYVQDDFRVLPRVTLNLGFRYEITSCMRSIGSQSTYVTTQADVASHPTYLPGTDASGNPSAGLGSKANCVISNPSFHNFSPRIGIAWDVFGNGKTAIRTGAGIYYTAGLWGDLLTYNVVSQPPTSNQIQTFHTSTTSLSGQTTPGTGIQLTLPLDAMAPALLSSANKDGVSYSPRFIIYDTNQPTLASWQFFIDQKLPGDLALSVGYVGSHAWHLYQSREMNPPIPAGLTTSGVPYYCAPYGNCALVPATPTRPNVNIGTMLGDVAAGMSWYNSLQVSLQKQLTHGIQFQTSYTFSKDLDTPNGQSIADQDTAQEVPGNPNNVDKGVSLREIPHVFRANLTYHVPNLKSDNFAAKLEHGWWMSSIVALQSGNRANLALGITRSLSSNSTSYADRGSVDPSFDPSKVVTGNINQWWNPSMFDIPALGTYGNSMRGILVGPSYKNVDFSIVKDTKVAFLGESGAIQFRAEFFNLLNRPQYALPNATLARIPTGSTTNLGNVGVIQESATSSFLSPSFGQITATLPDTQREVQVSLKVIF